MSCLRWWRFWHVWGAWDASASVTGRLFRRDCKRCGKPQWCYFWKETWD